MKYKLGDLVLLRFWDHSQEPGVPAGLIEIELPGRIITLDKLAIGLSTWRTVDPSYSHNNESFTILRSAITKVRVFR